jgi:proton glutamate symport protein
MAVFLGLFFAGALGLSFWILPAGLAALTPLKSREVLGEIRSAFVIALVTTLSVAALPFGGYTAAEVWLSWAPDWIASS